MKSLTVFDDRVRVVISDRRDGNMRAFGEDERAEVLANQAKVAESLGVEMGRMLRVRVDYGREDFLRYVAGPEVAEYAVMNGGGVPVNDGLLVGDGLADDGPAGRSDAKDGSTEEGRPVVNGDDVGLFLPLADCLGLVLYDARLRRLMLVHAGRHNLEQDGARAAVDFMVAKGSAVADVWAFLSPAAGKDNFPIFKLNGMGIAEAAVGQLVAAGVERVRIQDMGVDTTVEEAYFSHSRGDVRARFAIGARII